MKGLVYIHESQFLKYLTYFEQFGNITSHTVICGRVVWEMLFFSGLFVGSCQRVIISLGNSTFGRNCAN